MSAVLLAATAIAVLLLDLVARRAAVRAVATATDGTYHHKLDWLAERHPSALPRVGESVARNPDWSEVVLDNWADAEDVLDNLETKGFAELEMTAVNDTTFSIRWR